MNKIIYFFCLFIALNFSALFAETPKCDPRLKSHLDKIMQIPEAQNLIATIQKAGPFSIHVSDASASKQFGAYWDLNLRKLCVHITNQTTEGEIIGSILFELHNALVTSYYDYLDLLVMKNQIDKENYVRSYEEKEYFNSKKAAALAEKGIALGIFPSNARLPTYRNFAEHYHYQKIGGHSAYVARNFDQLMFEARKA